MNTEATDEPAPPLKGLFGLIDTLVYGADKLGLEAAEALRSKCPCTKHLIVVPEDFKPVES